jgi:hypothetical protein
MIVTDLLDRDPCTWLDNRTLKTRLRLPFGRLCITQQLDGSLYYNTFYYNLWTLVSVFAPGMTWLSVLRSFHYTSSRQIDGVSVTVRHLALVLLIPVVWNPWLSFPRSITDEASRQDEGESTRHAC